MGKNIWNNCLKCEDKCCKWQLACKVFTTPKEKDTLPEINKSYPCTYFNKRQLCSVHDKRPTDCKLFPFDILKLDGKFFWIMWKIKCPILNESKNEIDEYLKLFESSVIPEFRNYLEENSMFSFKYMIGKYQYNVLREVNL